MSGNSIAALTQWTSAPDADHQKALPVAASVVGNIIIIAATSEKGLPVATKMGSKVTKSRIKCRKAAPLGLRRVRTKAHQPVGVVCRGDV